MATFLPVPPGHRRNILGQVDCWPCCMFAVPCGLFVFPLVWFPMDLRSVSRLSGFLAVAHGGGAPSHFHLRCGVFPMDLRSVSRLSGFLAVAHGAGAPSHFCLRCGVFSHGPAQRFPAQQFLGRGTW